jgi:hypothetical protein
MCPAPALPLLRRPLGAGHLAWRAAAASALVGLAALGTTSAAWAQMVPHAEHALRQSTGSADLTTVRIDLGSPDTDARGHGLNLRGEGFWPHWEGRFGAVIDRPLNPLKDTFVLAQPVQGGLRVRSMHMLSDYYVAGGFRATAGLLRGETGQAWWGSGDNGGGLNLSLQRLDTLSLMGNPASRASADTGQQTMPYLGAGYSSRLMAKGAPSAWRFNADLGLITVNSSNINRITQVLAGDKGLEELAHDLRLRPVIKVSVGYSF